MRRPVFRVAVFIAFAVALLTPAMASAQGAAVTCDDFATQEGAQIVLDTIGDADIEEELDPNGDGIACDELPSRGGTDEPEDEPTEEPEDDNGGLPGRRDTDDTDEPTDEPTEEPADKPGNSELDARFGSPRDTWEEEYGQPLNAGRGEYPLDVPYEVDGFDEVTVFFHRDYVAYITLWSEPDNSWTERQAERVVEDFLPTDVELDRAFETDDGYLLTPAHSEALETRFGEGTYERYGASGERGDLFYLFVFDRGGDVSTIEIGLGNDMQAPVDDEPADEPTEEPSNGGDDGDDGDEDLTADDIAYLESLRPQFDTVAASMDEFSRILDALSAETIDAGDAGAQLRIVFDTWRQAAIDAESLSPTPGTQDTHDLYVEFVGLLSQAADDYTNGLLNSDESLLEAGDEKYAQATVMRSLIAVFLAAGGV